ncbi:MAG TPA: hypothetical protein PKB11_12240 [Desulfovibrio sp.]|uniref:hypothetical protein n=1 Tax=Desulfovibrio sp. TaxID=885 RepID=UPI002B90C40D|nr:hypothetical protein [Desulfovibrio sp.]HMM39518.1 hypothetical protein [Desulfovibrio sp.]
MSNETNTVSKVELLRQTQQAEGAKAIDRAEGVLALLHEIRDAVTSNSPASRTPPAEAMSPADIQEALAQLTGQLTGIQKALPRAKFWRWLLERLEDMQWMQEETRRNTLALVLVIILVALGTSLLTAFLTGQVTRSILLDMVSRFLSL